MKHDAPMPEIVVNIRSHRVNIENDVFDLIVEVMKPARMKQMKLYKLKSHLVTNPRRYCHYYKFAT